MAAAANDLLTTDIEAYLDAHSRKSFLRFITCGSVDDGKSTLIGRLLHESQMLFEDQLEALESDSKKVGTRGGEIDYALLLDGLAAEREQGITIDVAYRFFSTDRRKFIVADTPGHEQYTRNMVTGASTADLAIILIDARKGVLVQTRRHSFLVSLLGIRHIVLAVNKMDLVAYSEARFNEIEADYRLFARDIGLEDITCIPLSAVEGDNVVTASERTPWYRGLSLMEHLETVEVADEALTKPFRMPVQWVNRPNLDFRGFSGIVASGVVHAGDRVRVLPSGRESRVERIVTFDGDLGSASANQSVTLTLQDEIDISRGDVIVSAAALPEVADRFDTTIVWMSDEQLQRGRSYLMKAATRTVPASITRISHRIDVNTLERVPTQTLELNEIGQCEIALDRAIAFEAYDTNREMGSFILIDRLTNNTVAAGMIRSALRKSNNVHWQAVDINKAAHGALKGQIPLIVWFTGLSGAGKSTIANLVEKKLFADGRHTYLLDGDNVRHGLNKDLGFSDADRVENIRRVAEVAKLMVDAGLIVLTAFISPFRSDRQLARDLVAEGEFIEVFVDASLELAESRDPKGLYKKARAGEIKNFTGIDSPYEPPGAAEIHIDTATLSAEDAADAIIATLRERGALG